MPLSPEARADVDRQLAEWRAGFTLPVDADEVRATIRPLVLRLVGKYGMDAFPMLHDAAARLIGDGQPPRSAAQHWLNAQAAELRNRGD